MRNHPIPPFDQLEPRYGIVVVDGWNPQIRVDHRHLAITDGIATSIRKRRFHKAAANFNRLVVLGTTGYISFPAIKWLTDAKIALIHLDSNGRALAATTVSGLNNVKLRRSQALAATNPTGVAIARTLLRAKIEGQAEVAERITSDADTVATIRQRLSSLEEPATLRDLLAAEAAAANIYWRTWSYIGVQFPKADQRKIPDHWRLFGTRHSTISGGTRLAINPANAILNYLYGLLEAETRIACATAGLDPGIGVLHADQPRRDNLALDVMESVRPDVDAYLLDLIRNHRFHASDFYETERGGCRVLPPLTHTLAETIPTWTAKVGPVVEQVMRILADTAGSSLGRLPTPLTQKNRRKPEVL